jgi:hypothetical protein
MDTGAVEALYPERGKNLEAIRDDELRAADGQRVGLDDAEPAVLDLDVGTRPFETG